MKKIKPYLIAAILIGGLLFIKFKFFPSEKSKGGAKEKEGKKPATPVTVFVVGKAALENKFYASGTIVANEETELKAEASGRIIYLNLPEGNLVDAGTLLLKVNDADLRAQLAKINTQLKLAAIVESRQRKLLQQESISKNEYDIALSNLNSLQADSAYSQAQIAKTEVRAPFEGIIGIRNISKGAYVTPAIVVAKIQQINPIKIDFSLPEKYTSLLKAGDQISFQTEGLPDKFSGRITVKDPQVDINSRSVRYRALYNNPKGILLPGTFARIEIRLKENDNSLFVPTEAIVPVLKGKKVFVVRNGEAEEKLVETGLRTEDYVQVTSGIEVGDSVVVNGNFQLKSGSPVKVSGGKKK